MGHSSDKVIITREGSRNVNLIVVAGYIGITFVASRRSDEMRSSHLERDSIVEVERLMGNSAVAFEIVNYRVSVTDR